jgi:outer membrane protein assembly factor BamA
MVEERPAVSQIDFIGNKELTASIAQGLRETGLSEGRFDKALLDQAEQEIKPIPARGAGASVVTTVTPLERNAWASVFPSMRAMSPRSTRSISSATRRWEKDPLNCSCQTPGG